jgi:hypothetical protein
MRINASRPRRRSSDGLLATADGNGELDVRRLVADHLAREARVRRGPAPPAGRRPVRRPSSRKREVRAPAWGGQRASPGPIEVVDLARRLGRRRDSPPSR